MHLLLLRKCRYPLSLWYLQRLLHVNVSCVEESKATLIDQNHNHGGAVPILWGTD